MASVVLNTLAVVLFLDLTLCRGSPLESRRPSANVTANTLESVVSGKEELALTTAVTSRPASAGDEELATIDYGQPTQARDNATWVRLACPTDNADHFTTTSWYTCSNNDVFRGIYRINNGGNLATYSTPAGMYNITNSTAFSVTEREACSQDRVYVCRRWAKVGRQNQCWLFRIKNCTVEMSPSSQYPCRCTSPRSTVTTIESSNKSPSFTACGLAWLMSITTLIINM